MGRCENGGLHDTRHSEASANGSPAYTSDVMASPWKINPQLAQDAVSEVTKRNGEDVERGKRHEWPCTCTATPVPDAEVAALAESGTDELGNGHSTQHGAGSRQKKLDFVDIFCI